MGRKSNFGRADESEKLNKLFNKYFYQGEIVENLDRTCRNPMMSLSAIIRITNFLNLLTGSLVQYVNSNKTLTEEEYEKYLIFSITWAFGGIFEVPDRQLFHEYLWSKGYPLPPKGKETETIFDFYLDDKKGGVDWKLVVPDEWEAPVVLQFSQVLIPTQDSFKARMLQDLILNQPKTTICNKSILLIGGSGTAKTSSVLMYSSKFKAEEMLFKRMNMSSATAPRNFQDNVEVECDFKVGKDFAPPGNKLMTLFIDDINMPQMNKWGD
jgi:dynein heavy chain